MVRSEKGSALVLVMFVVLLLTILGVGVLSATIGGAQRTETRENDVQSLHLAQKGLNEATAYIQSQLEGLTDIDPDKLENILAGLDKQGLDVTTSLGADSSGTIEEIKYSGKQEVNDLNQQTRKYYINVTASAMVNGVKRTLNQQIVIDSYPDFLKYAFGSEKTLTLNGAPVLQGNIYAGEQLIVTNMAQYVYNGLSGLKKQTQFPVIKDNVDPGNSGSTVDTGSGEIHVQSLDSILYSDDGRSPVSVDSAEDVEQTVRNILGVDVSKIKIKEQKKFVQINVEESFFDKIAEAFNSSSVTSERIRNEYKSNQLRTWLNSPLSTALITTLSDEAPPMKPEQLPGEASDAYQLRLSQYHAELASYNNTFMNLNDSLMYNGNLFIEGVNYHGVSFTTPAKQGTSAQSPEWLIVNGNLDINNNKTSFLPISGNVLVLGNVSIKGNVAFDSTMIALGETKVEDAVIKGLEESGNTKELVLITKGPVLLNRIDAFTNAAPNEMDAFFYTDSSAELYGVGSIFWLKGGFFAKGDLTLNAALGDVSEPVGGLSSGLPLVFESQQRGLRERFKVIYNHEIYTHQQSSLPRVRKVNISLGPMELVSSAP